MAMVHTSPQSSMLRLTDTTSPRRRILPCPVPTLGNMQPEGEQYLVEVKGGGGTCTDSTPYDSHVDADAANETRSLPDHMNDNDCNENERCRHTRHHSDPDTFQVFSQDPNATFGKSESYGFLKDLELESSSSKTQQQQQRTTAQPSLEQPTPESTNGDKGTGVVDLEFSPDDSDDENLALNMPQFDNSLNEMEVMQLSHPLAF